MKAWLFPIILQAVGALVVVAEVFIPSMGMLTVIALGVLGYSLYLAFTTISPGAFYILMGCDILVLPLVFLAGMKILAASPLALKKELSADEGVMSQSPDLAAHLNKTGRTLTALRPAGTALIDNVRLDVVADGEFIEAGVPVRVAEVTGNRIVVERNEKDQ
ncbi:MAG: serine protease [Desulfobacter sp.]|nr:MAG: serine protease [Desulfobacter sp.]